MLLLYDNRCYYCSRFAYIAVRLSANRLTPIGLYSKEGDELIALFPKSVDPYGMFWIIDGSYAYGGLYALLKLLKVITLNLPRLIHAQRNDYAGVCLCKGECGLAARIYSLLSKRGKVRLDDKIYYNKLRLV